MNTARTCEKAAELARSLDFLSEEDLCLLAGITPSTADNWRKRHRGPPYSLIGNRYYYAKESVAQWLREQTRERFANPTAGQL